MNVFSHGPLFRRALAAAGLCAFAANILANPPDLPTGMSGNATPPTTSGSQMTITTTSQSAFLNWQTFNIAAGKTVVFNQPSASSIVINNIHDDSASQIYGSLQAPGMIVLINPSGFFFGPNSFIKTGGLIVSTANCIPPQNSGGSWEFNGPPPQKSIFNYGQIQVGNGGSVYLIADQIENHGDIEAPGGSIGLAAGQTVLLSERPDGRGMSMQVTLPVGSVDNKGKLIADGGTIAMQAQVVNQNGFIQANSVKNQNGVIELVAADQLTLGANSQISASGDNSPDGSAGGNVTLKSGNNFSDSVGSQITVTGGAHGGNGGNVEISAPNVQSLNSSINARAQAGWTAGKLLLDPDYIILDAYGSDSAGSGTVLAGDNSGSTLDLNVNSAFANLAVSQIILQAVYDITIADYTAWSLSDTIGVNLGGVTSGQLTLQAGGNIIFGNGASIYDANNWSVKLQAGVNNFAAGTIQFGKGSIYLGGFDGTTTLGYNGSIQTAAGNIDLQAGQDILVGSGFVRTTGGGYVKASALKGDIDTGTYDYACSIRYGYYGIDPANGVGGMSTEAGGNVTLTAGGNVTSFLPGSGDTSDAGTGAFGPQPGNVANDVTIVAGGNVTGHYVEANGTGAIYAGVKMVNGIPVDADGNPVTDGKSYVLNKDSTGSAGTSAAKLALSLIAGGWTVDAAQDIYLQEVRNPNGVFNTAKSGQKLLPNYHKFDYAADAYVNLSAGNAVQLGEDSTSLPRGSEKVPFIYAPILNISAGAGGVTLKGGSDPYNQLILFPSAKGSLTITTTDNGALSYDAAPNIFNLIVSDSSMSQYIPSAIDQVKYFGYIRNIFGLNDHADTPIHYDSPTPIVLNISGDMNYVQLAAPEAAQITVGGNMNNSRFQGMNLSSDPNLSVQVQVREIDGSLGTATVHPGVTSINVTGDILNRGEFTTITLPAGAPEPEISELAQAMDPSDVILAANLAKELFYDANTRQLTLQGALTSDVLNLLQNLTYQVTDANGQPQFVDDGHGGLTPKTATVNLLDSGTPPNPVSGQEGPTAKALKAEYASLGAIPSTRDSGYLLGGGGQFNIIARNIDLGTTLGIQSVGPLNAPALAKYFLRGADINVNVTGNLDMFSTTISSLNGGDVTVNAGGNVNIGSDIFIGGDESPRGIFTVAKSDVTVVAGGNINLNGSRIAAYDGGNITVESLHGNVDAGNGANGYVVVEEVYVDPVSRRIYTSNPRIPGSGILATTFPLLPGSAFPASKNTVGNILVETPEGDIVAGLGGIVQVPQNDVDSPDAVAELLVGYELRDANGNRVLAKDLNNGTPVPVLSDPNIVTLGPTVQVLPAGASSPVSLTQVLDVSGQPILDGSGHALYVNTFDPLRKIVQFVNGSINPYHNAVDEPENVAEPKDASGSPFQNAQGNPILVLGRNIDTSGSGVIGQNIVEKATGSIKGVIIGAHNVALDSQGVITVTALGRQIDITGQVGPSLLIAQKVDAGTVDPTVLILSQNANGNGSSFDKGTTANSMAQAASSDDSAKTAVASSQTEDDDKKKQKGQGAALMQKTGRVTILLPPKNLSQNQTSNNHL